MAVIARLWLLLSDILLGLSGNSSAFAACCFEGCACTRYQQKTEEKKEG